LVTNEVSHLHHEIKAVNIWVVFIRLIAIFCKNRIGPK
jgi:hypothetical protein